MNAHEARDNSRDHADDVADRWIKDGLANADVQATARAEAEAAVRLQDSSNFVDRVNAVLEQQQASTEAANQEEN